MRVIAVYWDKRFQSGKEKLGEIKTALAYLPLESPGYLFSRPELLGIVYSKEISWFCHDKQRLWIKPLVRPSTHLPEQMNLVMLTTLFPFFRVGFCQCLTLFDRCLLSNVPLAMVGHRSSSFHGLNIDHQKDHAICRLLWEKERIKVSGETGDINGHSKVYYKTATRACTRENDPQPKLWLLSV